MKIEAFTTQSEGFKIQGVLHIPDYCPAPCVICSHGLFSSKESAKFIAIANYLAARGFAAIRYDHRGCGESEGKIENTTVTSRLKDLETVYGFAQQHECVNGNFGLLGSSMGGFISLFAAARHSFFKALAIWATPIHISRPKKASKASEHPDLNSCFYDDLNQYQLIEELGRVKRCMVLHGQNDELVPVRHAEQIYAQLAEPKVLHIFQGADHRFSQESDRNRAMRLSADFFENTYRL